MHLAVKTPIARRTPIVLAALTLIAILAFALVSRLVTRYRANERQLAWHVFERGQAFYKAGDPARALDNFRAALTYDPDNFQYQLNLARALRDSGKLNEAEAYLSNLWQRNPEDGVINLALARLAVRRDSLFDAIRYYHNAIYGAWNSGAALNQRNARLELIHFLIQRKAYSQADSELIDLVQSLPPDPALHLQAGELLTEIADYDRAFSVYQGVLRLDPRNHTALGGAGNAAFQMGRYRTAQEYLTRAIETDRTDERSRHLLETANLVLAADPFHRRISDAERNRRLIAAFQSAGARLQSCAQSQRIDLKTPTSPPQTFQTLQDSWNKFQPQLKSLYKADETDLPDSLMDLITQIETQTAQQCGPPTGQDLALLLISRSRDTVDQ